MADITNGAPSAAQLITYCDGVASLVKQAITGLGLGLPAEVTTQAALAKTLRGKVLGDGSTVYGLGNEAIQIGAQPALDALVSRDRYDIFLNAFQALARAPENTIQSYLPTGWVFTNSITKHAFDAFLLRMNAANGSTPTTPASAGVVAAANAVSGGIPTCTAGNAPRIVHTLVGANDWLESLPSALATQTALTGTQNAYTYTPAGNVPTGVTKMRVYRGYVAGGAGVYYWDQDVAQTAGSAYVAATIAQPDNLLLTTWTPPAWLSCLMVPEFAIFFGISWGAITNGAIVFQTGQMLTPQNVVLGPSNGNPGMYQPASTAIFGIDTVGTGYVVGGILGTNTPSVNAQGATGALGVQARVTSVLNAAGTTTITYSYYAAATGYGSVQTATSAAATFAGVGVGQLATYVIPAGRLVTAVTADTPAGIASGTYVIEAANARTY